MAYRKGGPTLAGISAHDSSGSDSPVEASAVLRWRLVGTGSRAGAAEVADRMRTSVCEDEGA